MKPPVLLCYNLKGEKGSKLRLLAMRYSVRIRVVQPQEYAQPLAALCGLEAPSQAEATGEAFEDEMLLLAFFPPMLVSQFLRSFRQAGVAPISLKAVLTGTNARWDTYTLHQQLTAEHDALAAGLAPAHDAPAAP